MSRAARLFCAIAWAVVVSAAPDRAALAGDQPGGADWASYGSAGEDHYSPLDQINDKTIRKLGLAWSYDIDSRPNALTAPIAVGGTLYLAAGESVVHAIDAATGRLLWKYDPEVYKVAGHKLRAGWGIRGIAYSEGRVFVGTVDGRLLAVDAKDGRLLWSVMTINPDDERYVTGPPWVFNGKVAIGHGGADFGAVRGYVTAYDQKTGSQVWRFYTVPGDPGKGFENPAMEMAAKTWTGEWWQYGGGGTVWNAMAYDPKFNRLYFGTGNGAPWNRKIRSPGGGDNLFISSIVAVNADTGEYAWHYQVSPGDSLDFDAATDIELADLEINGKTRPVLIQASKNGFFYVIDRTDGKLLSAEKFVRANWAEGIDLRTGRPVETPAAFYPDGKRYVLYPSSVGGHSTDAMSFNPKTGLAYIPAIEQGRVYADPPGELKAWQFAPGQMFSAGVDIALVPTNYPPDTNALLAWDPVAQRVVWRVPLEGDRNGGTMTTAGNLVMQGGLDGNFVAYAADTGRKLWSFYAQTAVLAQPIAYLAGGRQYITVIAGSRSVGTTSLKTQWDYYTQKWRVLTFALGGTATLPPEHTSALPVVDDPSFTIDAAKAEAGKMIFGQRCAACHGRNARSGGAAPDLRKAGSPLSLEAFSQVVRDGTHQANGMPRFEELSSSEVEGLQHYIRRCARDALTAQK